MARESDADRLRHAYHLFQMDRSQGTTELEDLANTGSVMSAIYLGDFYLREPNINVGKAEKWLKVAYEGDSARGLYCLATCYYEHGKYSDAEKVLLDGVSRNDSLSMYCLARIYVNTNRYSSASPEVMNLLERSAALGQVRAMREIWLLYIKGAFGIWNIPRGIFLLLYFLAHTFKMSFGRRSDAYGPSDRRLW